MAKGRDRPGKEKKKPKADKNKKPKHQPLAGKMQPSVITDMHSVSMSVDKK